MCIQASSLQRLSRLALSQPQDEARSTSGNILKAIRSRCPERVYGPQGYRHQDANWVQLRDGQRLALDPLDDRREKRRDGGRVSYVRLGV